MKNIQKYKETTQKFLRIVNKLNIIEKKPKDFGTGDKLFPTEIHTIEAIGKNSGINITELAAALGVSKAAVSKIANKIVEKEYAKKYKSPDNEKEVLLKLTGKGITAFKVHEAYHRDVDHSLIKRFRKITQDEFAFFDEILSDIEAYTDLVIDERK